MLVGTGDYVISHRSQYIRIACILPDGEQFFTLVQHVQLTPHECQADALRDSGTYW
jgi:hypothetical protein